jgi:hypothetical protein
MKPPNRFGGSPQLPNKPVADLLKLIEPLVRMPMLQHLLVIRDNLLPMVTNDVPVIGLGPHPQLRPDVGVDQPANALGYEVGA